jgi:hypothetical protein
MAWQLSDISQERTEQEMVFKELQNAINYLDHAPVGFFSAGRDGEIVYLNATLADWLGIDLTSFLPGKVMLRDLVAGAGMALVDSVQAEPGLNRTAQLDLDLLKIQRPEPAGAAGAPGFGHPRRFAGRKPDHRHQPRRGQLGPMTRPARRCASPASSTIRRWRSPRSTATARFSEPTGRSCRCFTAW